MRRRGRVVEGARLESVYRGDSIVGSNPTVSARYRILANHREPARVGQANDKLGLYSIKLFVGMLSSPPTTAKFMAKLMS